MEFINALLNAISNAIAVFMLWMFVSAGLSKLMPSNKLYYQQVFEGYGITLPILATTLARLLGCIEVASGLLILFPETRLLGALGCGLLLFLYLVVMSIQIWQGKKDMDCGCAGPAGSVKVSPALLVRNIVFIGFIALCVLDYSMLVNGSLATQTANVWILAVPMAILLVLIHQSIEQLLVNGQKLKLLKAVM